MPHESAGELKPSLLVAQRLFGLAMAVLLTTAALPARAETPVYHFSVLNQHSPILIAEYWNPILNYLSQKTGVTLRLKIGKTAPETTELTVRGEAQFAFTNHLFSPDRVKLGWKVIATTDPGSNRGLIVAARDGPLRRLEDLRGQKVAFPSQEAFMGLQGAEARPGRTGHHGEGGLRR